MRKNIWHLPEKVYALEKMLKKNPLYKKQFNLDKSLYYYYDIRK